MKFRKAVKKLHLWVALILCLPLVMMGITGSIQVFEEDIGQIADAGKYQLAEGQFHSAGEIINAAKESITDNTKPSMVRMPDEPGNPATVRFGRRDKAIQVLVDPVSLKVLESGPPGTGFFAFVKRLHTNLLIPGPLGRSIIGWFGVAMLFMGITGIIIWWPKKKPERWKTAFTFKWKSNSVKLNRDMHSAFGIWTFIILIIVTFAGVYLAFPQTVGSFIRAIFPGEDLRAASNAIKISPLEDEKQISVDRAINIARNQVKNSQLVFAGMPAKPDQPYRIVLRPEGYSPGQPVATVFIDPWRGTVLKTHNPAEYTAGQSIIAWQHALHTGHGLGTLWKIAVFLTGFLPLLFSITGITMWYLKRQQRK